MTTPTVVSTNYQNDGNDFLKAKVDRSGAPRTEYVTATIPDSSTTGTTAGLVPFRKGARLVYGATQLAVEDLDTATSVTLNVGYIYADNDTVTNVNDVDAFATLSTAPQAGGLITLDEVAGLEWVATADGWIIAETAGATTTTEGAVYGQVTLAYDNTVLA